MDQRPHLRLAWVGVIVALVANSFVDAAGTATPADAPDAMVTVLPTHYRWAGKDFDDLDALAATVLPRTPRSVGLDACGASALRLQKAAAQRFGDLYVELRVLDADAPACTATPGMGLIPVGQGLGAGAKGIDDAAVERWWQQRKP